LEAAALRMRLEEAYALFQQQRGAADHRQLFLEVDVATAVAPAMLVGRTVRIYWPGDDAWYLGEVKAYNRETKEHTVGAGGGPQACVTERGCLQPPAARNVAFPAAAGLHAPPAALLHPRSLNRRCPLSPSGNSCLWKGFINDALKLKACEQVIRAGALRRRRA
jgi:hypothetical protein